MLAKKVFHYTKDPKKASGRALGTLVEIISFYLMESWGFSKYISIEKGLIEYGNPAISHNVEYSLHPTRKTFPLTTQDIATPITSSKILKFLPHGYKSVEAKSNQLLTSNGILRNSCIVGIADNFSLSAKVEQFKDKKINISITEQYQKPFAMVECKRVGVEEGTKKGPQTIEKAKQGAYVAKTVSSLQKIRHNDGSLYGAIPKGKVAFYTRPYMDLLNEIINSNDPNLYKDFILTIGVVSNHGNWFTAENTNKELKVLAQSYDWLLFLTDKGISEFISELLVKPTKEYKAIKKTFTNSYQNRTTKNQFTKVQMSYGAHLLLLQFFKQNKKRIESWFNIITPSGKSLNDLQDQLQLLAKKDWSKTI